MSSLKAGTFFLPAMILQAIDGYISIFNKRKKDPRSECYIETVPVEVLMKNHCFQYFSGGIKNPDPAVNGMFFQTQVYPPGFS